MSVPDSAAAATALRCFLGALGVPIDTDPELEGTPERAARAFCDELLDGYRTNPAALLSNSLASREDGLVAVTHIGYVSMCPHHLLPSQGIAHVGYVPAGRIAGLGVIVELLEALSHRLVLQETLGRQIAAELVTQLGAAAAGVVLEARHACLYARGGRQSAAVVVTQSFEGRWASDVVARAEFLHAIAFGARRASELR